MKLRLKGFRVPHMTSLVCPYNDLDNRGNPVGTNGKTIKFSKIGDTSPDLDDRVAYSILAKHSDMLEVAGTANHGKTKIAQAPSNK